MGYSVGDVVEGTVSKITHFGAFIDLADGKRGLVHISEISNTYVNNIREFVKENDKVKAKVVTVNPDGRMDLSIKRLQVESEAQPRKEKKPIPVEKDRASPDREKHAPVVPAHIQGTNLPTFEEKLSRFLKNSDDRLMDLRRHIESRRGGKTRV